MTNMNTGAASLSDEQKRAAITACALMIKGICLTTPNAEWTERIENRIHYLLRQIATTPQADAAPIINGHAINDLFLKWSEWTTELGEAISRKNIDGFVSELRAAIAAGGAQEAVRLTAHDADMFWPELDGEQMYHSLDDAVTAVFDDCGADAGDTFTFTCAARLPKVTVQIIEVTENGFEWEEIDLAKEPK